jgi:uncharacterized protein YcfJ
VKAAQGANVNNTVLAGVIVGGVALAAAGAIMANSGYNPLQKYASVVAVEPAFETTRTPRVVCGDEATLAQAQAQSQALAQGLTPGEAAAPPTPPAPDQPPASQEDKGAAQDGEAAAPQCLTVYDTKSVEAGYDVTYELDGVQKVVRMDREPGKRIPVEDGELVLTQS